MAMDGDDRSAARRERSRAALVGCFADLVPVLAAPLEVEPILADGVAVDMGLGGGRFYGEDGRLFAQRQVEAHLARPVRFLPDFQTTNPAAGCFERRLLTFLIEEGRRQGLTGAELSAEPDSADGTVIVLGIGLGHHLPLLLERTRARHLLVVESEPEFLRQSLGAIEWREIVAATEGAGGVLRLMLARSAAPILTALRQALGSFGLPYADGAHVFQHYANPVLDETARGVGEAAQLAYISRGYFEDERTMLSNAAANLACASFRLLDARPRPARREPAIIIANGPSLDRSIEPLKRLVPGAVVFSCGTALRVCRRHGIAPDFHCESENISIVPQLLAEVGQSFGLGPAILVASTTADPLLTRMFAETWFYFREASSSTRLLAAPGQELDFAAPTASNLALRAAAALGFRTLYLFGVDCGSRFAGRVHAEGSPYDIDQGLCEEDRVRRLDLTLPGNFGGSVASDHVLGWTRTRLAAAISRFGLTVHNCSDGARIEGARPQQAAGLRFARPVIDRDRLLGELRESLPAYPPGVFAASHGGLPFTAARADACRFFDDLSAALEAARREDGDFFSVWRRLAPFAEERPAGYGGVTILAFGAIRYMAKAGGFVLRRIPDPDRRRRMLARILEEFCAISAELRETTLGLLDDLERRGPAAGEAGQE